MCSIMGIGTKDIDLPTLRAHFDRTASRGPDSSRILETGHGYLCFHRLAIMDLSAEGMQPFTLGGSAVVCNGELYGFRAMRERLRERGYRFRSESDCELLLPLYEIYGLDMFRRLDAEFALVLYDGHTGALIAARDPLGIRPLFYGYVADGSIVFASEAKNLAGLVEDIFPFPPGHYYAGGSFTRYRDIAAVPAFLGDGLPAVCRGIRNRLIDAVTKRIDADAPLGFLLSGGLDSSLVCAIAARQLPGPIRTFAIGMEEDAIDLKYARMVAGHICSEHTEVVITRAQVREALPEVIRHLATYDITTIRASMGMYLLCRYIHAHTDVRVLLTGEVSDELFGYKYTDFAPSPEDFQAEAIKRIREIHMYDVLRADRCISTHALEARVPFGDLAFVEYVLSIPPEMKMNTHQMGKYLLRKAFADGGWLPEAILYRDKAAFSDAVGHSLADDLKALAEETYTDQAFEAKRRTYARATPFTKESLLYREHFERWYPGQAHMIKDFWMPNRAWAGCDVDDPSARALANYGASGQ